MAVAGDDEMTTRPPKSINTKNTKVNTMVMIDGTQKNRGNVEAGATQRGHTGSPPAQDNQEHAQGGLLPEAVPGSETLQDMIVYGK